MGEGEGVGRRRTTGRRRQTRGRRREGSDRIARRTRRKKNPKSASRRPSDRTDSIRFSKRDGARGRRALFVAPTRGTATPPARVASMPAMAIPYVTRGGCDAFTRERECAADAAAISLCSCAWKIAFDDRSSRLVTCIVRSPIHRFQHLIAPTFNRPMNFVVIERSIIIRRA